MKKYFVKVNSILYLSLFLHGCGAKENEFENFYFNLQHYNKNNASKVLVSYKNISPQIKNILLEEGHGTKINTLCRFYGLFDRGDLKVNSEVKDLILQDKYAVEKYLDSLQYAGNVYRDCAETFNLPIKKRRNKNE